MVAVDKTVGHNVAMKACRKTARTLLEPSREPVLVLEPPLEPPCWNPFQRWNPPPPLEPVPTGGSSAGTPAGTPWAINTLLIYTTWALVGSGAACDHVRDLMQRCVLYQHLLVGEQREQR